jgi:hypothetical protein
VQWQALDGQIVTQAENRKSMLRSSSPRIFSASCSSCTGSAAAASGAAGAAARTAAGCARTLATGGRRQQQQHSTDVSIGMRKKHVHRVS